MNEQITYPLFKRAIQIIRNDLHIRGCIVLNFNATATNQFPLWHKAPGIQGILPIWDNDNLIHLDF